MNALGRKEILCEFPRYLAEYGRLEREWESLKSWQWIKLLKNLRRREKLTKWYQGKMQEWEL